MSDDTDKKPEAEPEKPAKQPEQIEVAPRKTREYRQSRGIGRSILAVVVDASITVGGVALGYGMAKAGAEQQSLGPVIDTAGEVLGAVAGGVFGKLAGTAISASITD